MKNEMFEELLESVKEAKAIKNKELKPSRAFLMQEPNPKDIRTKLELTQAHFAALMNISVHTLRNWEKGRRQPKGPAKVLLNIVSEYPDVFLRATMYSTLNYYHNHAETLIERYENASMVLLHNLLIEVLPSEGAVLDIGFGSGRDLEFLYQNGFEIWGIDPTASFVLHVKQRFTPIADHFYQDRLPFTTFQSPVHFDGVLAIAFWMHLGYEEYAAAVRDIVRTCKPQATVVISYSEGSRGDDGRLFYEVDQERLVGLFVQEGFALNVTHQNADALARSSLQWKTIVFKR